MTTHRSGWLAVLVRRTKPIHLVAFFGAVAGAVAYWLETKHTAAAEILLVSLVLLVTALVLELVREVSAVQDTIARQTPCDLSWDDEDTLYALKSLEKRALRGKCQVRAVWSAMRVSPGFQSFILDQLKHIREQRYTLDRWVDVDSVDETTLLAHVTVAFETMKDSRYTLHLVTKVPFGAMVVNEEAAAINFAAHHTRPDVIGISSVDTLLAQRVRSLIDALGPGEVLARVKGADVSLAELQQRISEYYRARSSVT